MDLQVQLEGFIQGNNYQMDCNIYSSSGNKGIIVEDVK
ncbi:hypothetical protein GPLA_4638 [Paraglaciecola polaris LMG 21857]|uniref:Uncharacterized protein n=1 Tax=Paraglaciecola polaris LMG 21857 TaxID=1129793 RepID=K6ZZ87_9ALTE|nr:hypothetical protein GPLA_4638 [Paraglaciecola polaris LMG 21857]